jgi:glutaconyl-CoA/methylmalonyl-CoA decarboxylase subunit gamma
VKSYKISVNGQSYDVTVEEIGGASASPRPAAAPSPAVAAAPRAPAPAAAPSTGGGGSVKSPMPGTLLSYKVAAGQAVKAGDVLLILEAMKMENEITAPADGVVASLGPPEGASVSTGDLLVAFTR